MTSYRKPWWRLGIGPPSHWARWGPRDGHTMGGRCRWKLSITYRKTPGFHGDRGGGPGGRGGPMTFTSRNPPDQANCKQTHKHAPKDLILLVQLANHTTRRGCSATETMWRRSSKKWRKMKKEPCRNRERQTLRCHTGTDHGPDDDQRLMISQAINCCGAFSTDGCQTMTSTWRPPKPLSTKRRLSPRELTP